MTTYYLYDEAGGASPLLEETYSGSTASVSMGYGQAADGLRARYAPVSGGLYYLFQWDPQGSLVQRQTGGPGSNISYYALDTALFDGYGAKLGDTDAFTGGAEMVRDAMGFQGEWGAYTDTETGLVLMGHRYYDAGTGRFLTRDPIGYNGGINLYGFTGNNPVNESDPSGLILDPPTTDQQGYFAAIKSLKTFPLARKVIARLNSSKTHYQIIIKPAKTHYDTGTDEFDFDDVAGSPPNTKAIFWDPHASLTFKEPGNSGSISPAVILLHELGHAYDFDTSPVDFALRVQDTDPIYDDPEEAMTMKSFEFPAAKFFKQGRRTRHSSIPNNSAWDYRLEYVASPLKAFPSPK